MRTLLILVDGMRPDALPGIPVAEELIKKGKSTMTAQTVLPSSTLPCHMSLFHSVDPDRHGTATNTYAPQVRPIKGLFEVLAAAKKTSAMFYSWHELRDVARPGKVTYASFMRGATFGYYKAGKFLTGEAIRFLSENETDFAFLYLGHPDAAGHGSGWMGEEYLESVKTSFDNILEIVNALPEDYTVFITADHGGHNRTHGSDLPEDMTIPLIVLGSALDRFGDLENVTIKDIAPTITELLGVEPDEEWEGKSLLTASKG